MLPILTEQSREIKDQAALFKKFAGIRKASQDALIANELKSAKLRTAGVTIEQKRTNLEADRLDIANSLLKATEKRDLAEATLASKKKGGNQDEIAAAQLVFDRAEANLALEEEKARVKREGLDVAGKTLDIEEESARLADSAKSIEAVKIANEVLQIKKQQLDVEQKILAAEKSVSNSRLKILENEAKLKSLQETGSLELNPKDQLKLDLDTAKATFEFAIREAALKKEQIDVETDLQKSRLDILKFERKLFIEQTKLEIAKAKNAKLPTEGLDQVLSNLEGTKIEESVERQKEALDSLAKAQKRAVDAGLAEAGSNFKVATAQAFVDALGNDEIYQTFRQGLQTNLEAFFKGEKSFGRAIGDTIVSVLEKKASILLDQAFDLFENASQTAALGANTSALLRLASVISGTSFTPTTGTQTGSGGLFGAIGGFVKSIFSKGPTSLAETAGVSQQAGSAYDAFVSGDRFEMGGIMQGGFKAFANGGIVDRPTFGLVGEGSMNEAVVPLPDGKAIPVNMNGTNNNNNVAVNINMSTGQSDTTGNSEQLAAFGNGIVDIVQREIADQTRPGGLLAR
jgi:hypothetical protein